MIGLINLELGKDSLLLYPVDKRKKGYEARIIRWIHDQFNGYPERVLTWMYVNLEGVCGIKPWGVAVLEQHR